MIENLKNIDMTEELKMRIITGAVLIIAAFIFILAFSTPWFAVVALILLITIGGLEWSKLVSLEDFNQNLYVVGLLVLAYVAYCSIALSWLFIALGLIGWLAKLALLYKYEENTDLYKKNPLILKVAGFLVIIPAWSAALVLHEQSSYLVLLLVFIVAAADTGAYFAGKEFGKTKLVPQLSPGKTREGVIGGFIAAIVVAFIGGFWITSGHFSLMILAAFIALISVAGDLFISLIKREAGSKDTGSLLPGHGGILDRVDGLLASLPLFAVGICWLSIQG